MADKFSGSYTDTEAGKRKTLTADQAEALWNEGKRQKAERAEKMPTEVEAITQLTQAVHRLKELGWSDAVYCPKDGSLFEVIEVVSSGIHQCYYDGEWPKGSWWIVDEVDVWPSRPILYRRPAPTKYTEAQIAQAIKDDPGQAQCETERESRDRAIGWLKQQDKERASPKPPAGEA